MASVVLVVDMLRGFLEEGHALYCGDSARRIIPNVRALLEEERGKGSHIIFVADTHDPDDKEFQMFPPHCVRGTAETEVIPELRDIAGELLPKNRYSAFFNTPLEKRLRELAPEKLIICGVCTDICVLHTAADARNRDYQVEVPADCVASFDREAHSWALKHMQDILGVRVLGVEAKSEG
ncbi:MAG: isochorismatase family cysteine hydrolase [Dehalococcoidia bacterium]